VYGFLGLGANSTCQAATGSVYKSLAQSTGGAFYNVCDKDWTQTFSTLAKSVSNLVVTNSVAVPKEVIDAEILKVEINGRAIAASKYKFENGRFWLDLELAKSINGEATVSIRYKK
jgi:hypothetical protein